MYTVTKLSHANGNDTYGNPRRLFLIQLVQNGYAARIAVIEEGYNGNSAWSKEYPEATYMGEYEISPSMYRVYLKMTK
jgi:hypothetical protein